MVDTDMWSESNQFTQSEKFSALRKGQVETFMYVGETDSSGRACGKGVVVDPSSTVMNHFFHGKKVRYEGTFLNDKLEGTCVITAGEDSLIAEFREGKYFGKSTLYKNGGVWNWLGKNKGDSTKKSGESRNAFYKDDGTPEMAFKLNAWKYL